MVLKVIGQSVFCGLAILAALVYNPPPYTFAPSRFLDDPLFAPVPHEQRLTVAVPEGQRIPAYLVGGKFFRNGPNPIVKSLPYHWFDGDGSIHAATFADNATVVLENRLIRTQLLALRNRTKTMLSFLAEIQYPWRAVRTVLQLAKSTFDGTSLSMTTANTALLWHQQKLLALVRLLPYCLLVVSLVALDGGGSSN
jgi:carotenoid cleavage dioxygenase-like enzyme